MFTNLLNEEEKAYFLEMIYKLASCDNEYSEEEEELVNSYKKELGINVVPDTGSMDDLISYFSDKNSSIKKIVFFETYGMLMADGKMEKDEAKVFGKIKEKFNLGEKAYTDLVDAAEILQAAYDKVYDAVF